MDVAGHVRAIDHCEGDDVVDQTAADDIGGGGSNAAREDGDARIVANEAESARLRKEAAWLQTERMALAALEADLDKQRITLEAERKSIAEQRESVAFDKALVSALLEEAEESHENSVAAYEAAQQYAKAALIAIAAAPQTTQMRSNLKRVKMESSA